MHSNNTSPCKKYSSILNREIKVLFSGLFYGFIVLFIISCNKTSSYKNEDYKNPTTESNSLDKYSINELFKIADTLFYGAKYKSALNTYNEIINRDSTLNQAYYKRAFIYYYTSQYIKAEADIEKSLSINNLDPEALNIRGLINRYKQNYSGAYKDFKNAIELHPNYSKSYRRLASLLDSQLQYDFNSLNNDEYNKNIRLLDSVILLVNKAIELDSSDFNSHQIWMFAQYQKIYDKGYGASSRFSKDSLILKNRENWVLKQPVIKLEDYESKSYFYSYSKSENTPDSLIYAHINLLKKAIEIFPENPIYYDLLAEVYEFELDSLELSRVYRDKENKLSLSDELYFETYLKDGDFYPYVYVDQNEDFDYPLSIGIGFFLDDIKGYSTNNENFYVKFEAEFFNGYFSFLNKEGDSLNTVIDNNPLNLSNPKDLIKLKYIKADNTIYDGLNTTEENKWLGKAEFQGDIFHNWDLKEYPFDKQNIKIQFESTLDTTVLKFTQPDGYYQPDLLFNKNMEGLKAGYNVDKINFNYKYKEGKSEERFSPFITRKPIYSVGEFEVVISREGSWLLIKLFLGAFLACLISWIAFLIPTEFFDSQISVSVGAIFGAIGNKYFVESTIPAVQILTKADILNNLAILIVLLNIFLLVARKSDNINLGIFEKNLNSLIFSIFITIVTVTVIILN